MSVTPAVMPARRPVAAKARVYSTSTKQAARDRSILATAEVHEHRCVYQSLYSGWMECVYCGGMHFDPND